MAYAGGVYIGLGEGDRSPEIVKLKALLKRKFTPARNTLDDPDLFTPALTTEVIRVQAVYTTEGPDKHPGVPHYRRGIVNVEFKYDVGLIPRPPAIKPIILTVEGHMSNMWIGPCAQTASTLEQQGVCHWKPVGDWDTQALPFNNGSGVEALYRQLSRTAIEGPVVDGRVIMWPFGPEVPWGGIGFSQGAMVWCEFMWKYVLPPRAPLHWRLDGFRRGLMFGNPRRAKNAICSWAINPPDPDTSGIMLNRLFDAHAEGIGDRWAENANDDDMFAEVKDDESGRNQAAIARIVTENSWTGGPTAIFSRAMAVLGNPLGGAFGVGSAIVDAVMFLAMNPNPHYGTFATAGDIEWMRGVAA